MSDKEDKEYKEPPVSFVSRVILFLTGVVVVAVTYVFSYQMQIEYEKKLAAYEKYVPVDAKILESKISKYKTNEGYTRYSPSVKYTYSVNGKFYETSRLGHKKYIFSDIETTKSLSNQYVAGTNVKAYYNFEKPSEAVLINDPPMSFTFDIIGYILGVFFIISAFFPSLFKAVYSYR